MIYFIGVVAYVVLISWLAWWMDRDSPKRVSKWMQKRLHKFIKDESPIYYTGVSFDKISEHLSKTMDDGIRKGYIIPFEPCHEIKIDKDNPLKNIGVTVKITKPIKE